MLCAVCGCYSNNKESYLHFFRFPADPKLREIWIKFCDREDEFNLKTSRICGKHFRKEDLERNLMYELGINKKYIPTLKPGTYPTIKHTEDTSTPIICEPLKPIVSLTIEPAPSPSLCSESADMDPLCEALLYDDDEESTSDCLSVSSVASVKPAYLPVGPASTPVTSVSSSVPTTTSSSSATSTESSSITTASSYVPPVCTAPTITTVSAYIPTVRPLISPATSSVPNVPPSVEPKGRATLTKKLKKLKATMNKVEPIEQKPLPTENISRIKALEQENCILRLNQEKLQIQMKRLKTKLFKAQYELQQMDERLKEVFTAGQVKKLKTGEKRLCWSESDIVRSVTLYSASPKAYKLLMKQKFPLPAIRTVQDWAKKIDNSLKIVEANEIKAEVNDTCPPEIDGMQTDEMQANETQVDDEELGFVIKTEETQSDSDKVKPVDEDYVQVAMLRGLMRGKPRRRRRIPRNGIQKQEKPKVQRKAKAERKTRVSRKGKVEKAEEDTGKRKLEEEIEEDDEFQSLIEYDEVGALDFVIYDPIEDQY